VVAASLTKLVLRLASLGVPRPAVHRASAAAMLAIVATLRLGESAALPTPLDDDSRDRMGSCIKVLAAPEPDMVKVRQAGDRRGRGRALGWCLVTAVHVW
jgi:coatomer subunit beta